MKVFLLQSIKIISDEGIPLEIGSPRINSLFAYLILNRNSRVDRRQLAYIFWPESEEGNARRNLRQYLHRLRKMFNADAGKRPILAAEGNTIQINPELDLWVDVEEFLRSVRPDSGLAELQSAISLYTGDLLVNIYDDWCQNERTRLRKLYVGSLGRISSLLQASGSQESAVAYARKWVASEPLDEEAHRQLMAMYYRGGDRTGAIQQYQALCKLLDDELDIKPLAQTQSLYQAIRNGKPLNAEIAIPELPPDQRETNKGAPEIVGREDQLHLMHQVLNSARNKAGRLVLITGESGVGKTRLAEEHVRSHTEFPVIKIVCKESEALVPYAPLRPVLMEALERLSEHSIYLPPLWQSTLSTIFPRLNTNPQMASEPPAHPPPGIALGDVISEVILNLSRQYGSQPLQIILDDLQWGDHSTWEILARLAGSSGKTPLLVIGLCRLEDLSPEQRRLVRRLEIEEKLDPIKLTRLTPQETTELAQQLMPGKELDSLIQSRLFQETEGNPFFIVEYIRGFNETGRPIQEMLIGDDGGQSDRIPATIRRLIEAHLHRLSLLSQELLSIAAALGRGFTLPILAEVSQEDTQQVIQCIEEWQRQGLVREDIEGYDFGHEKIRQLSYGMLSRAKRQYIHRRIAEVYENTLPPTDPAAVAYHYRRSDKPIMAIPYLTLKGEQALRMRSYHTARQFGLQAINLLGRTPGPRKKNERIDLNLQLAQAYAFAGDLDRAIQIMEETEHLALSLDDQDRLGKIFRRSAQMYWLRGKPGVAGDYARRALRSAEEIKDTGLLQAALRMLGRVSIATSTFDDAIAYLFRYVNMEMEGRAPPNLPVIYGYLGVAYARVGSWARAEQAAQHGVDLAEKESFPAKVAFARMQLASVYADFRNWELCLETLDPISDPLEADRMLAPHEFMLLSIRGRVACQVGDALEGKKIDPCRFRLGG